MRNLQYQEIFALSQALPGPASTKMLYTVNYIHGGFLGAILALILWWYVYPPHFISNSPIDNSVFLEQ